MCGLASIYAGISAVMNLTNPFLSLVIQDSTADDYYHGPQKSPNGLMKAYTAVHRDRSVGDVSDVSLYVMTFASGHVRRLVRVKGERNVPVVAGWSADGKRVLYWPLLEYGSSSVNADGSGLMDISAIGGRSRNFGEARRKDGSYVFSPDGKYLAVVEGGLRFVVSQKRIAVFDYRTRKQRFVSGPRFASIAPTWSPNSSQLAFVATRDDYPLGGTDDIIKREEQTHLWVANRNGTGRRQLTKDPRYHEDGPHWLTDGTTIQFVRADNKKDGYLSDWEIRADGTGLKRISKSSK